MQNRGVASVGHQAGGKHELAEGGAMSQEDQRNCWVGDFTQCLEEVARLGDALGCVSPSESVITYWAAQQLKVPIGLRAKLRGELTVGDVSLITSARHKQAFVSTHGDFDTKSCGGEL